MFSAEVQDRRWLCRGVWANVARIARGIALAAVVVISNDARAAAVANWQLVSESDGISVATRRVEGSAFAEVRASATVCATIPQLVEFVEDVDAFDTWIPDTERARLLARPSPHQRIYYIRTSMPWPVKHRDMIYALTEVTEPSEPTGLNGMNGMNEVIAAPKGPDASVLMQGLPEYLPPAAGVVRMTAVTGRWDFSEGAGTTRISLQMHIEPGGTVPVWLANRRIVDTPSKMLLNLKRRFESACHGP